MIVDRDVSNSSFLPFYVVAKVLPDRWGRKIMECDWLDHEIDLEDLPPQAEGEQRKKVMPTVDSRKISEERKKMLEKQKREESDTDSVIMFTEDLDFMF